LETTGVERSAVVPSPSCPEAFDPQHNTDPETTEQLCAPPAATAVAPLAIAVTGVGLGVRVPFPSWPEALAPQHCTAPLAVTAQVCACPADTASAPDERPETASAKARGAVVPSPSCPWSFNPQHRRPPPSATAQPCEPPAASEVGPADATAWMAAQHPAPHLTEPAPHSKSQASVAEQMAVPCP
jgi:hypothetical protein